MQKCIEVVRADYGVQAHFGKRWLANILLNLPRIRPVGREMPTVASACITAAGPSLDEGFARVAAEKGVSFIIATDTSLPALRRAGIAPDAVLSIDCQVHGYHHFMQGVPESAIVFLDAASPPFLARRHPRAAFVASHHPLLAYFLSRGLTIPRIDMSGGNVTHAAVALGRSLGASRVSLFGADFSYPDGKSYARGTYLYDYFGLRQDRLAPLESHFYSFLFRSGQAKRQTRAGRLVYTTPVLTAYRDRLVEMITSMDIDVMPAADRGLPLPEMHHADAGSTGVGSPSRRDPAWETAGTGPGWKELLSGYVRGLEGLSDIPAVPGRWLHALSPEQAELVSTLLPVAACIHREKGHATRSGTALEAARQWTLQRIRRLISEGSTPAQA